MRQLGVKWRRKGGRMSVLLMDRLLWLGLGAVCVPGILVEGSLGLNGFKRLQTLLWLLPCNISRGVL